MQIPIDFIKKYDKPGPRYTSYPPATDFHTGFTNDDYRKSIVESNKKKPESISIYIHIPFCPQRCHFCGCNTIIGKGNSFIHTYVDALINEIDTVAQSIDKNRFVTQVHWGGGTPNSINYKHIERIMNHLRSTFKFADNSEIAIECSPAYLSFEDIDKLTEYGFNRVSLGVQDTREDVLNIVNRRAPKNDLKKTVDYFREKGFKGINIDLIYGLPLQTEESFKETVKQAITMNPDRLVTFSYAHVPWVKGYQKLLETAGLPKPEEKMKMLVNSYDILTSSGYVSIGMDHFAKPEDNIAIALETNKLHRNFQGYCTTETTGQVYGFGASSISQLWGAYVQNTKDIYKYVEQASKEGFAVERGYSLSQDEQIRRAVINEIMCNNRLNFNEIALDFNISPLDVRKIVDYKAEKLSEFEADELVEISENEIQVSDRGRLVVRNIAMAFDPTLDTSGQKFSKTV